MLRNCYKCYKIVTISHFTVRKRRMPSSRGRAGAQVYRPSGRIYARASWKLEAGDKLETSWKGAGNMWIIGAGIMVCGLLSMVFAPILLSFAVMGIGALIAWACSEEEHKEESKRNAWRKAYPPYRY